jgi:acyl-CoA thioester hydrolase
VLEKLMTYPVVLTPHIAGYSHEAIEKMSLEIIRQLFSVSVPIAQTFVQAKKFELSLIVDQEHLDHNDHVNNLEYIKWAHWISGKHWEAEAETIYREKLKWVVVKNEIEYLKPLFHGDEVRLETWIEKIEKAKCWRRVNIYRKSDQQLMATALIVWYALDAVSGRPSRIPQELADHFLNIPPTYSNL